MRYINVVFLRGFFKPVVSFVFTSRTTLGASKPLYSCKKARTASGSCLLSSRKDQDIAFTTISSRSLARRRQTSSVRVVSPLPPRALLLSATVHTSAVRRHQRSPERA